MRPVDPYMITVRNLVKLKKKLEQQNNDKNGGISIVLNFQGSIMTSWHPH